MAMSQSITDSGSVEYRDVPGIPGCRAGSDGTIWTRTKRTHGCHVQGEWRKLAQRTTRSGYLLVNVYRKSISVHRLVLLAFVGPCPPGMEACHFPDRERTNNALSNLRWDTKLGNATDKRRHETMASGTRNGNSKLTDELVRRIRTSWANGESKKSLSRRFGVTDRSIRLIVERDTWKHLV